MITYADDGAYQDSRSLMEIPWLKGSVSLLSLVSHSLLYSLWRVIIDILEYKIWH